ncbi:MAG: DUF2207 domain-containing protein [Thermoleophilia bacterium]|nr:DUF2207 domain-containing protein [Thermoleophilia bacterium]
MTKRLTNLGFSRVLLSGRVIALALVAVALAALFLVGFPSAAAQAKDVRIQTMDVTLAVQENGDVVVDEKVTFYFEGNYHFVARDIPAQNTEGITDIAVYDESGAPLPRGDQPGTYSTFREGDTVYIQVNFDLADTAATWTFHYRAKKVILFWNEGDELRWYVLDDTNTIPVDRLRVTVTIPDSVPAEQMTHAVQTMFGIEATVSSPSPSTLVYEAAGLPAYAKFWTVTGFPKGVVKYVWTPRRLAAFVVPKLGFALPIIFFLALLLIWRRRGRDEPASVYARYVTEPPSDLPPALAGALIDEKVDVKEVLATIIDLARRGYLEITESNESGRRRRPLTIFTRCKPLDDLQGFEAKVAQALFDRGHPDQVTVDQLRNRFYSHIPGIVEEIYKEVTARKLFHRNPKQVRSRWVAYGIGVAVVLGLITVGLAMADVGGWGWFMFGAIISVVMVFVFGRYMPQRTARGASEQRKWEAFRNYLRDLTRFQDLEAAKDTYEKYLPYAVAFGVEKEWTRRFEGLEVPPPTWYHPPVIVGGGWYRETGPLGPYPAGGGSVLDGPAGGGIPRVPGGSGGGISLDTISDGLFRSLNSMSQALTSVPSGTSSTRGAFGGGGFSGGGFGGGFSGGGGGGGFRAG